MCTYVHAYAAQTWQKISFRMSTTKIDYVVVCSFPFLFFCSFPDPILSSLAYVIELLSSVDLRLVIGRKWKYERLEQQQQQPQVCFMLLRGCCCFVAVAAAARYCFCFCCLFCCLFCSHIELLLNALKEGEGAGRQAGS